MLNNFGEILTQNPVLAILVALLGGIVSSFSPCTLSTLPLIIGYVSQEEAKGQKKRKPWMYSVLFCIGLTLSFVIIGLVSTVLGYNLKMFGRWWYLLLAVLLTLVSLYLFGIFSTKKQGLSCRRPAKKKTALGAFLVGILGGFFDSPCSTPILIVILSFAAESSNILLATILMIAYSVGHCTIMILAGTSLELVNRLAMSEKYRKIGQVLKIIFAVLTLAMALYLFYIAI